MSLLNHKRSSEQASKPISPSISEDDVVAVIGPVGRWHQYHGDTNSSKRGSFVTGTMRTSEGQHIAKLSFKVEEALSSISLDTEVPSNETVVLTVKNIVKQPIEGE